MKLPPKAVIWACAVTLGVDLAITELWFDMRPLLVDAAQAAGYIERPHWLPRCDQEDGKDIDFAFLWRGGKPKCVDLAKDEIRS